MFANLTSSGQASLGYRLPGNWRMSWDDDSFSAEWTSTPFQFLRLLYLLLRLRLTHFDVNIGMLF
jgi:hypothetical protein